MRGLVFFSRLVLYWHKEGKVVTTMDIRCVWEHNGEDTLLYAEDFCGAYARGASLEKAMGKLRREIPAYLRWRKLSPAGVINPIISEDRPCDLTVRDADSDVLFASEKAPLTMEEYLALKALALKSAEDFLRLYEAVPDKNASALPQRKTFYGPVPRTAEEMYRHTTSVNTYYFAEIGVDADNEGTILDCRTRGFALLEQTPGFLENPVFDGSYGELWSLRKVLRRFLWHDRIHAKAMWRMARKTFGEDSVPDVFHFEA